MSSSSSTLIAPPISFTNSGLASVPDVGPANPLRILLVDDHPAFRRGLCAMLAEEEGIQVVGEAASGEEALANIDTFLPDGLDLVLMDLEMPGMGGIEATKALLARHPELPVVMLTASGLEADLFEAIEAGALGYLTKNTSIDAMARMLREYQRDGSLLMSRAMAARVLQHLRRSTALRIDPLEQPCSTTFNGLPAPDASSLTAREWEVLALVARGKSDQEVAEDLVLSLKTAKKHVENIRQKLGVRNRVEAARWFWEQVRPTAPPPSREHPG